MHKGLLLAGAGLLAVVAGCSSSSSPAAAPSPSSSASATTATTATAAQYASIVASSKRDVTKYIEEFDDCTYVEPPTLACALTPMGLGLTADSLKIKLDAAVDGVAPIGPPPAELEQLVEDTKAAAAEVKRLTDKVDCNTKRCKRWDDVSFPVSRLQDQLDAWEPYL